MIHLGGCCQEKPSPDSFPRLNGQTFRSLMDSNPLLEGVAMETMYVFHPAVEVEHT